MAETSYPFADDSAGGGGKLVSVNQWQDMSHLWASDRIDFTMVDSNYTSAQLPFNCEVSGTNLIIYPGQAWVGGFYYKLDAPLTIPAPTNSTVYNRKDLIVIRVDMATGSANIAILQGQASISVTEPAPRRVLGGIWEMPLWCIEIARNNGTSTFTDRRRFDVPSTVSAPWWRREVSNTLPPGSFTLDLDIDGNSGHEEGYQGANIDMVTRTLGPRRKWTPDLLSVSNKPPVANREGYWRVIAPGTIQFSLQIRNTSSTAVKSSSAIVLTLPRSAANTIPTILHGVIDNPQSRDSLPNFIDISAKTSSVGNNLLYLYYPATSTLDEGLNVLTTIPGRSTLIVSGVYESEEFEGSVAYK